MYCQSQTNLKAGKWGWNKWNGHILVYIYHKQCGIMQKIQWKSSNGQLQWFNKATSGALCWKRQKTQKLEKLKRKLLKILNMYDLYRGVPCESWRPELSENVVVFEIWRFKTKVIGCQSRVKFREKILVERWRHKKKSRPQYWVLRSETESAWAQHGWFNADSMAALKTHYCGRDFFLWRLLFFVTDPKIWQSVNFEQR